MAVVFLCVLRWMSFADCCAGQNAGSTLIAAVHACPMIYAASLWLYVIRQPVRCAATAFSCQTDFGQVQFHKLPVMIMTQDFMAWMSFDYAYVSSCQHMVSRGETSGDT